MRRGSAWARAALRSDAAAPQPAAPLADHQASPVTRAQQSPLRRRLGSAVRRSSPPQSPGTVTSGVAQSVCGVHGQVSGSGSSLRPGVERAVGELRVPRGPCETELDAGRRCVSAGRDTALSRT